METGYLGNGYEGEPVGPTTRGCGINLCGWNYCVFDYCVLKDSFGF